MTDQHDLEERISNILRDLGCEDAKIYVSDIFPGIAALPLINAVVVCRHIAEHLSDEDLKAILAHEVYHLGSRKDRRRRPRLLKRPANQLRRRQPRKALPLKAEGRSALLRR